MLFSDTIANGFSSVPIHQRVLLKYVLITGKEVNLRLSLDFAEKNFAFNTGTAQSFDFIMLVLLTN
jgi:hypothetical protein